MRIITKATGKWQQIEDKPIEVFDRGLHIPKRGYAFLPKHLTDPNRKQRGEITEFSFHARQRLRRSMLTESVPDSFRYGITFTVPWKVKDFSQLMDDFRDCWNRFGVQFRRKYPNSAMIFRVELQTRGAPHIHALTYIKNTDAFGGPCDTPAASHMADALRLFSLVMDIKHLWSISIPDLHHGSISGFEKRGVLVEPIKSDGAMMRYICDHTSKHKQAQLGYKGKQWGKLGKSNLVKEQSIILGDFDNYRHEVLFFRLLRKSMRYRVTDFNHHRKWKRKPPFGSVLRGSKRSVGEFYLSSDVVRKMWDFTKCQANAS